MMTNSRKKLDKIPPCPRCIEKNKVYIMLENGKESDWVCPQCGHKYWNVSLPLIHNIGWKEEGDGAGERRQATQQIETKHQDNKSLAQL